MTADPRAEYRRRIYGSYVTGRDKPLAPDTVEGLRPRLPYLRALVRRHFPAERNARIVDLGCGHGALLYVLHAAGYTRATGVDRSAEQVAAARSLGIAGVSEGDVFQTLAGYADGSLDVVVAFDLIEHFAKDELMPLVDQVHRVLRSGGVWIVHVPNAEGPFGAHSRYGDFTHEVAFTRVSLSQVLLASGFSRVACYEDTPAIHGPVSAFRGVAWWAIRNAVMFYVAVETGSWDRAAVLSQNMLAVAQRS